MKTNSENWLLDFLLHHWHSLHLRVLESIDCTSKITEHVVSSIVQENVFHLCEKQRTPFTSHSQCDSTWCAAAAHGQRGVGPTLRSLWMIGLLDWWRQATASQVSQNICKTSASEKPVCNRWFIRFTTCPPAESKLVNSTKTTKWLFYTYVVKWTWI